jgi:DNA helicase-2/ATP-dependent DNA helicase PcrA
VIAQAAERYTKDLWSTRRSEQKPLLVVCEDEYEQTEFVARTILEHREGGIALQRQAVLFRTGYHSDMLEVELARRNIPFVKYGGLKFLEAAHVKDLVAFLRLAENPQDQTAGLRVLQMIPGFGPARAKAAMRLLAGQGNRLKAWESFKAPAAASEIWPAFIEMMSRLAEVPPPELPVQVHLVRDFYGPLLEQHYEHAAMRQRDLEQLEQMAAASRDRATFLADLTLDPPTSTADLAGAPLLDEDYLILSTIHSAKGCEWDAVYVIHAADGCIPSDMATGDSADIEEELRLFYVALTRAKDWLYVCFPLRYYHRRHALGDSHSYAQLTRFLPDETIRHFEKRSADVGSPTADTIETRLTTGAIRSRIKKMWE